MKLPDIARLRLVSQHIVHQGRKTPGQLVAWMGAVQAQDAEMAKWAVGVRLPEATVRSVDAAMDKGKILRTHILRPTWHLVSARDIHWMLELTGPHIRTSIRARHRQLGLTPSALAKSACVIERTLSHGGSVVREELVAALRTAGFGMDNNRMAHLLMLAELDLIVCSGPNRKGKQSYALLNVRTNKRITMKRDEALAALARRYLRSHGPASMRDFVWWSGLPVGDARKAFGMVCAQFKVSTVEGREYWHAKDLECPAEAATTVRLLPAYDEFTISYADRSASIADHQRSKAMSSNGIFRPLVIVGGEVAGIWRRLRTKKGVNVNVSLFTKPTAAIKNSIEVEAKRYEGFLQEEVNVSIAKGRS